MRGHPAGPRTVEPVPISPTLRLWVEGQNAEGLLALLQRTGTHTLRGTPAPSRQALRRAIAAHAHVLSDALLAALCDQEAGRYFELRLTDGTGPLAPRLVACCAADTARTRANWDLLQALFMQALFTRDAMEESQTRWIPRLVNIARTAVRGAGTSAGERRQARQFLVLAGAATAEEARAVLRGAERSVDGLQWCLRTVQLHTATPAVWTRAVAITLNRRQRVGIREDQENWIWIWRLVEGITAQATFSAGWWRSVPDLAGHWPAVLWSAMEHGLMRPMPSAQRHAVFAPLSNEALGVLLDRAMAPGQSAAVGASVLPVVEAARDRQLFAETPERLLPLLASPHAAVRTMALQACASGGATPTVAPRRHREEPQERGAR